MNRQRQPVLLAFGFQKFAGRCNLILMVERLTAVFFIILCLMIGTYLIFAPWDTMFGRWSENYLLTFLTDKTGIASIQTIATSNWFRGAISGLGVVNILVAIWEAMNFNESVEKYRELSER